MESPYISVEVPLQSNKKNLQVQQQLLPEMKIHFTNLGKIPLKIIYIKLTYISKYTYINNSNY